MSVHSKTTADRDGIRKREAKGGKPAAVKGSGKKEDPGILRINFPGRDEERLENISPEEFFKK